MVDVIGSADEKMMMEFSQSQSKSPVLSGRAPQITDHLTIWGFSQSCCCYLRKCGGSIPQTGCCSLFWVKSEENQCRSPTSFWREAETQSERKLILIIFSLLIPLLMATIQHRATNVFLFELTLGGLISRSLRQKKSSDKKKFIYFLSFLNSKIKQNNTYY